MIISVKLIKDFEMYTKYSVRRISAIVLPYQISFVIYRE